METFRYIFSKAEDTLDTVAKRFRTTEGRIRDLSNTDGQKWADHWLVTIDHLNILQDGDVLIVPVPDPIPSLPAGADWKEFPAPSGATVRSVIKTLKTPVPKVGRIIDDTDNVATLIWDYYRNAPTRRAVVQAGLPPGQTSDACTLPEGASLLVPVYLPQEQTVCAAPSPVSDPQTSATIDVKPDDRFSKLAQMLQDVERALDDVDAVRARIAAGLLTAENICTNFIELKESMEETARDFESANTLHAANRADAGQALSHDAAHEGESAREAAIAAIDPLIDKALQNLRGRPVWQKEYPTAESDLKIVTTTLKDTIKNAEMMKLVVDLVPTVFSVPMSVRGARLLRKKRTGIRCLTYLCHLAARAAVALANSPVKADGNALKELVGHTKLAGNQCADLIEYACACTRGFEKTKMRPTNPAPFSCLGVVSTLHMANALEQVWTSAASTDPQTSSARAAVKLVFHDLGPLFEILGVQSRERDRPDEWIEAVNQKFELYSAAKEGVEAVKSAIDISEPLRASEASTFLESMLSPFGREEGPLRELIPKSARSLYYALQAGWETGDKLGKMKESSDKETGVGVLDTYKSSIGFKKAILEGAKALEFIEGEGAEWAEAAIDFLGRATFLLTVIVETAEAAEAAEAGDTKAAEGHVALAASAICFLIGGATAGAASGAFVAVGTILLVGGIVATKGDILVKVYEGDTVTRFKGIKTSQTPSWANNFGFSAELSTFQAAFEAADFIAGHAALQRLAVVGSTRATP